jgi:serine protease Do
MRARDWILSGCLACSMGAAHALEADQIFEKLEPSIWVVTTYNAQDQRLAQGSAVVVTKERLVTNCHVLAKAKSVVVKRGNIAHGAKLEHADVERDLCQLKAAELNAPAVEVAPMDSLRVGQKVYALGNPRGLELSLSDGLISSLRKSPDNQLEAIQTTAPVSPGSSGGGLFDSSGRLIGITTLMRRDSQNLNFAVPAAWIGELPERSRELLAKDEQRRTADKPATTARVAVAERQLVQRELIEHFGVRRSVTASINLGDKVIFKTSGDGTVEFISTLQSNVRTRGTYRVKPDKGEVCIWITSVINLFQNLGGCYRVYAIDSNQYILRSILPGYFIKYGI